MNEELIRKWIEELRSGRYKQGHYALRLPSKGGKDDEFCCLGVACDVVDPTAWALLLNGKRYAVDGMIGTLPYSIRVKLFPRITFDSQEQNRIENIISRLVTMNDTEEKSFEEIADYLEERLLNG